MDLAERREVDAGGRTDLDVGQPVGRGGEQDGGVFAGLLLFGGTGVDPPAARDGLEGGDGGLEVDGGAEAGGEGVREDLETFVEGELPGFLLGHLPAAAAVFGAEDLALDEGAVSGLEGGESGEAVLDGEPGRVPGVDSGDQGLMA
ncbi:MAG: hypothetical protein M5U12_31935 [Verrucomicrobia bacterium]|nr:hypothetical protein [Verrucomicrobiota bacterium]